MAAPVVDVVVIGYRSEAYLPRLFQDLRSMSALPHAVHYWDNIGNPKNLPMAWNDEAARGKAPYIAILQPDMVLSPDWDLRLCNALEIRKGLGVAHAWGVPSDVPPDVELMTELAKDRSEVVDVLDYDVVGMDALKFFCPMIRRRDWEILRGMDERLRFIRMESEFMARLRYRLNLKYGVVHDVRAWHRIGASIDAARSKNEINTDVEHQFADAVWERIRKGMEPEWQLLAPMERQAVRANGAYSLRQKPAGMKVHVIAPKSNPRSSSSLPPAGFRGPSPSP